MNGKRNYRNVWMLMTALLLAAAVITGCSNFMDDEDEGKEQKKAITFTPMEIWDVKGISRGSSVTKETITSYGVTAAVYPAAESYTTAECGSFWHNREVTTATGESHYYWPGESYRVSFYAYYPYGNSALTIGAATQTGKPSYSYTVPAAVAEQLDVVTAEVLDMSGAKQEEPVTLGFRHRCCDIRFLLYNESFLYPITIKKIVIKGVKYSGTLTGNTWELTGTANSAEEHPFLLTTETEIATRETEDITGTTNHFIILPQTVSSGTEMIEVWVIKEGQEEKYAYQLPEDMTLEAGKSYTFTMAVGEDIIMVSNATSVADWEMAVTYLLIQNNPGTETMGQPDLTRGEGVGAKDWEEETE